jgi:hypothetical protein
MKRPTLAWSGLALLGALAITAPALGDAKDGRNPLREDRKELREDRERLRDARRAGDGGAIDDAKRELRRDRLKLTKDQLEKRKEHLAELRQKWGGFFKHPGFRDEMRLHHHRMAKLRQIERTAKAEKKDALAKRVDALMAKEKARHQTVLDGMKADGGAK